MEDETLAFCYLNKDGDEKNKAVLTTEKLYIIHRKTANEFDLLSISDLGFNHRKIMMPLIVGGIMASLSMVSIFKDFFDPYIVVITLLVGLGLFYWGWSGQMVFTVYTKIKEFDFSIPMPSENLSIFIEFIRDSGLMGKKEGIRITFFLILDQHIWNSQPENSSKITLPKKPHKVYFAKQLNNINLKESVVVEFDPLEARAEVRFLSDPDSGKLQPFVMDDIYRESILSADRK